MQKVIVILGQTATGKSKLAVGLAREINGEIISADSRQVYKNLNLGTGKVTKKEMRGVKHHLLDVANPKRKFSVHKYQKLAISAMADIPNRGKIPIVCGGTGFYIDAVIKGVKFPEVPPKPKLRKQLALNSGRCLMLKLRKLDSRRAKNIDPKNKVRLIRAIEIAKALGRIPYLEARPPSCKFIKIGLYLPPNILKKKIKKRLLMRIKRGMLNEARKLHAEGLSWKRMEELGLEYRYMALHLQNKITKQQMLEKLSTEIYRYAKRQMTWFKRDAKIKWFDPSQVRKSDFPTLVLTYLQKVI